MALARMLPQAEMVVVTTPQLAAQKVAARVADMARRSHMPIVGVVENMAGFTANDGTHYDIFGSGGGASLADELGVPLLGSVPIDPRIAEGADAGKPVVVDAPMSPASEAIVSSASRITEILPPLAMDSCVGRLSALAAAVPTEVS